MLFGQFQNTFNIQRNYEQIIFTLRYIGILANISLDNGVRENAQREDTSQLVDSMFKQVSLQKRKNAIYQ